MLPGVESARRRRLHKGGGISDSSQSLASNNFTSRRSSFCLYASNNESRFSSSSSLVCSLQLREINYFPFSFCSYTCLLIIINFNGYALILVMDLNFNSKEAYYTSKHTQMRIWQEQPEKPNKDWITSSDQKGYQKTQGIKKPNFYFYF